jgi:hypothetical protein
MRASQDRTRLPARQVWARFGVTDRTLDRWLANADLKFPLPLIINRRRYFFLDEIEEWERAQARRRAPTGRAQGPATITA